MLWHSVMLRRNKFRALGWLAALSLFSTVVSAEGTRVWRRVEVQRGVGDSAVRALAVATSAVDDPGVAVAGIGLRIATGGQDGATLGRYSSLVRLRSVDGDPSGRVADAHRLAQLARVQDLHFARDGALWIATAGGLWRLDPADSGGRLEDRSPGGGEAARRVRMVVSHSGVTVVATEAGAYATIDGRSWLHLNGNLPLGPIAALALRRPPADAAAQQLELWLVARGTVRRMDLSFSPPPGASHGSHATAGAIYGRLRVSNSQRVSPVAGLGAGASPVQILLDWPDQDAVLLYESAIAVRNEPGAAWQIVRPVLPPGAKASWLARVGADYWLATDRGLLRARHWRGPWRRAASPLGSSEVYRVVGAGDEVLAATGQGLFVGRVATGGAWSRRTSVSGSQPLDTLPEPEAESAGPADPPVLAIQRAALRYVGLRAEYVRDLRRGVKRRGWLPVVSARVAGAFDRDLATDYDEAFLSGETRHLYDRDWRQGRDFDVSLLLTWDLGDIAYNPEAIDLEREARQLISLRDDVLDQINQAYFERQSLLHVLESLPGDGASTEVDRRKLQLRVDELAAGLDGWTGGWFGHELERHVGRQRAPAETGD